MHEIVVCADAHEGIRFGYNIDPETGVSERALDIHRNLKRAADFAIQQGSRVFVILGDLFERPHIAPDYREMVRRDVIRPLIKRGVRVWVIGGNHDQPHNPKKSTSLDDFSLFPEVTVYKEPTVEELSLDGKMLNVIIFPYLHPENIGELLRETGKEVPEEQIIPAAQEMIRQWLAKKASGEADCKILLAHYYVEGAKLRKTAHPEVLPEEFKWRAEMIPSVDFCVFGHVHLHQCHPIGGKEIIYPGAIERIDWGERNDKKGFISISPGEKRWEFIELPCRDMIKIEVEIGTEEDPTDKILSSLPDVSDKMVRVEVSIGEAQRGRIVEDKLREALFTAFHSEVKFAERKEEKTGFVSFTTDPFELLRSFIELNYSDHPKKELLIKEGQKVLREVLE